jgi:hypothetical protein
MEIFYSIGLPRILAIDPWHQHILMEYMHMFITNICSRNLICDILYIRVPFLKSGKSLKFFFCWGKKKFIWDILKTGFPVRVCDLLGVLTFHGILLKSHRVFSFVICDEIFVSKFII